MVFLPEHIEQHVDYNSPDATVFDQHAQPGNPSLPLLESIQG